MNSGLVGRGATPRRALRSMVRKRSPVRVRKRALEEEAATGHLSPIDADHCSRTSVSELAVARALDGVADDRRGPEACEILEVDGEPCRARRCRQAVRARSLWIIRGVDDLVGHESPAELGEAPSPEVTDQARSITLGRL